MLSRVSKLAWLVGPVSVLLACGESAPAPKSADDTPQVEPQHHSALKMSSEIGGLDEDKVNAAFEASLKGLERCLQEGASRVEFLGGAVSFFVKIDVDGKADGAYLEKSTLGDRDT